MGAGAPYRWWGKRPGNPLYHPVPGRRQSHQRPFTAYQQQLTILRLADREMHPRQALLLDFDRYLTSLASPESQLVIMGDFNEVVGLHPTGFSKITTKFSLVDIHGHFHSVPTEVPTYARGKDRLDYIFCTAPLLSATIKSGAKPFNQHIHSDHRALFVDWNESLLFGSQAPFMTPHTQRRLQSKCTATLVQYIDVLHKYCESHSISKRLKELELHPSPNNVESLDRDITRGMLSAEKRCRVPGVDPWSKLLKKARVLVDIFKHALSMVRIGLKSPRLLPPL